jgi:small subunit ribosomal protein S20
MPGQAKKPKRSKQVLKRQRQALKARERNRSFKGRMRKTIKEALLAVSEGAMKKPQPAFDEAQSEIQHLASKGVISKKTASRKVSRLARKLFRQAQPQTQTS